MPGLGQALPTPCRMMDSGAVENDGDISGTVPLLRICDIPLTPSVRGQAPSGQRIRPRDPTDVVVASRRSPSISSVASTLVVVLSLVAAVISSFPAMSFSLFAGTCLWVRSSRRVVANLCLVRCRFRDSRLAVATARFSANKSLCCIGEIPLSKRLFQSQKGFPVHW
jgi:hypothetical protein